MRRLLSLSLLLLFAPRAEAGSWIARSFAGLLADADAVVVGTVGDATRHTATLRVERVLSGPAALGGRDVTLPVVRCGQPGPDGSVVYVSTCLDRTYRPGDRMLLLLVTDGAGYRETSYPAHTRFVLPDGDAPDARAERLLALSTTDADARASALTAMLADSRPTWRRDAAEAADPGLSVSPRAFARLDDPSDLLRVALDRLADPLARLVRTDRDPSVRAAAAAALGRTRAGGGVTEALLAGAADPAEDVAHAATGALGMRRDPAAADALLALAARTDDPDRRRALVTAAAPVVGTRHGDALAALVDDTAPDDRADLLAVWALTGDPRAADAAARRLDDATEPWAQDEALRTLAHSRDPRYADRALARLQPVVCDEVGAPRVAMEAAAMLAPNAEGVGALAPFLACPVMFVRWSAATALAAIDLPASRAVLVGHLRGETDDEVRGVILAAVGTVTPGER